MTEYGITKDNKLIRESFTYEQAKSFTKAKEDSKDKFKYAIVSRVIGEWEKLV